MQAYIGSKRQCYMVLAILCMIAIFIFTGLDKAIAEWTIQLSDAQTWLRVVTFLGDGKLYFSVLPPTWLICWWCQCYPKLKSAVSYLLYCQLVAGGLCIVLKILFGRARPDLWLYKGIYGFYGFQTKAIYWSFPSGHTMTVMSFTLAIALLMPKVRWGWWIVGAVVAGSRVLLHAHYLSDVMMATLLAYFITLYLYKRCRAKI